MSIVRIQNRRGTAAQWLAKDPILGSGEVGFEIDTGNFKIGDGTTSWEDLPYFQNAEFATYLTSDDINVANGVAPLDGNSRVPLANLYHAIQELIAHNADTTGVHGISDTSQLATISYVDNVASGITAKPAVEAATTENLSATYSNGTSGVGATLTANSSGEWAGIDGVTTGWNVGDGVLVKNQTNAAHNGRYVLTNLGSSSTPWILTRCGLCDTADEIPGMYIFVKYGTVNAGSGWVAITANPATFVVGTDAINLTQFAGSSGISAGTGISLNGTQISIDETVVAKLNSPTFVGTVTAPTIQSTTINATTVTASLSGTATNASRVDNRKFFVQVAEPDSNSGRQNGDIWIKI